MRALSALGLRVLGVVEPRPDDRLPASARSLVLIGNAGPDMWRLFSADRVPGPHPLDRWIAGGVDSLAARFGARALYPSDGPPYHPFQAWARRAGTSFASPLGILIHPEFGLWHGYRAALLFNRAIAPPTAPTASHPCEACADRPCLTTCPVGAFIPGHFDVAACAAHLKGHAGADCRDLGCRARRACPVGRDHVYAPAQAAFHMRAFLDMRDA